jgi:hypothetical protein
MRNELLTRQSKCEIMKVQCFTTVHLALMNMLGVFLGSPAELNASTALQPSPLNKVAAFCCRDSDFDLSDFKVSVSAVQLTALTSDSVNRDNRCSLNGAVIREVGILSPCGEFGEHIRELVGQSTPALSGEFQKPNPHHSENNDGVAAPSTDYGVKLPVRHKGLSRVGDNALGSAGTRHTRTSLKRTGKAIAFTTGTSSN